LHPSKSITNAGMGDSFGVVQVSRELEGRRRRCKASAKEVGARRWHMFVIIGFSSPGVLTAEEETHMK